MHQQGHLQHRQQSAQRLVVRPHCPELRQQRNPQHCLQHHQRDHRQECQEFRQRCAPHLQQQRHLGFGPFPCLLCLPYRLCLRKSSHHSFRPFRLFLLCHLCRQNQRSSRHSCRPFLPFLLFLPCHLR